MWKAGDVQVIYGRIHVCVMCLLPVLLHVVRLALMHLCLTSVLGSIKQRHIISGARIRFCKRIEGSFVHCCECVLDGSQDAIGLIELCLYEL